MNQLDLKNPLMTEYKTSNVKAVDIQPFIRLPQEFSAFCFY